MVCKLSSVPSQSHVQDLLRLFVKSDTAEVLLLLVNMHEIKLQVMNHMRSMIEEEETLLLKKDRKQKLFLILLHFPPSKFKSACYPSLFLRGWDHYYLDTIAHSAVKGVVDIRSWFRDCCFPPATISPAMISPAMTSLDAPPPPKEKTISPDASSQPKEKTSPPKEKTISLDASSPPKEKTISPDASSPPKEKTISPDASSPPKEKTILSDAPPPPKEKTLVIAAKEILNEAIPILASRVFFGLVHGGCFNKSMSGSERTNILKILLFEKGLGDVLCEKFCTYWKPSVMSEYLKKIVVFTRSQDSTLNITDSIQTTFKSLFFDFLVYMISRINEDCNIDVLFTTGDSTVSLVIQRLFLDIVRVFQIPKLSELKVRSAHLQQGKQPSHLPQFPFFKTVFREVQKLVENSREEANTKINLIGDLETNGEMSITCHEVTNQQPFLIEIVVRKVKNIVEVYIHT